MRGDEVLVEVGGPGVSPGTVSPRHLLELADAYLMALAQVTEDQEDQPLIFTGLEVLEKCAALAVHVDRPTLATRSGAALERYVADPDHAPRGVRKGVVRLVHVVRSLPPHYVPASRFYSDAGEQRFELLVTRHEEILPPREIVAIRAVALRAGGSEPVARFEALGEPKPFVLAAEDWETIRKVGAALQRPLDLVARVYRSADGAIAGGDLLEVSEPVRDSQGAWERWYAANRESVRIGPPSGDDE